MSKDSINFFKKYWQTILIAVSINLVINVVGNIGAYQVVLYKIDQGQKTNESQSQAIFQLQSNQTYLYGKFGYYMPYKLSNTRGGKKDVD